MFAGDTPQTRLEHECLAAVPYAAGTTYGIRLWPSYPPSLLDMSVWSEICQAVDLS